MLLDIRMPGLSGLDLAAAELDKVRRRRQPPDIARLQSVLEKLERGVGAATPTRLGARHAGTTRFFGADEITRIYASSKYPLFRSGGREYVLDESLNTSTGRSS